MLRDVYGAEWNTAPQAVAILQKLQLSDAAFDPSGKVTPQGFSAFVRQHQGLLYPAHQMQRCLRRLVVGEGFWRRLLARRVQLSKGELYVPIEVRGRGRGRRWWWWCGGLAGRMRSRGRLAKRIEDETHLSPLRNTPRETPFDLSPGLRSLATSLQLTCGAPIFAAWPSISRYSSTLYDCGGTEEHKEEYKTRLGSSAARR